MNKFKDYEKFNLIFIKKKIYFIIQIFFIIKSLIKIKFL